jgi:hypothetical protein
MICEIINPSDPYTLRCQNFLVAAVAVAFLGSGNLGLRSEDGEQSTPVLFGWEDWLKDQGIEDEDLGAFAKVHRSEMADILDSVMIGDAKARQDAEAFLAELPEDKRAAWLAERHDRRRSSANDIGAAAWSLAKRLRRQAGSAA